MMVETCAGCNAARSLFTFLPLQLALSGCDADGGSAGTGSWESRDSEEQKTLLGPQWDEQKKRRCTGNLGFRWKEIPPVPEPAARRAAPLRRLPRQPGFVVVVPPELGLGQCGSWVSRCSLAARKTSWRGWKILPRWAAVAGGVQAACGVQRAGQGRSPKSRASLLHCSGPGSAFHSLEKSSNHCLKPNYPQLPAQPRRWLPLGGETEAQRG